MKRKEVSGFPEIQAKHKGICKGCKKGKNGKNTFLVVIERIKEYWR